MKSQDKINEIYRDLIAKLGELYVQESMLKDDISKLRARVESLNILAPEMIRIEKDINSEKSKED